MEIVEYKAKYKEDVKNILVELQEYIVSIDHWHLNIITPDYRKKYFEKTIKNCSVIFLAIEEEKVIGLICGNLIKYDKYDLCDYACPKTGHIEELIVSKNTRNKGVGQLLLNKMEYYFFP